jgi:hypothetical protein
MKKKDIILDQSINKMNGIDKNKIMIWVKITANEQDLERCGYKPLVSGNIYQAEKIDGFVETNSWKQFYNIIHKDEYFMKEVWRGVLKVLTTDEVREYKLNELGI